MDKRRNKLYQNVMFELKSPNWSEQLDFYMNLENLDINDSIDYYKLLPKKLIDYISPEDLIKELIEKSDRLPNVFTKNLFLTNEIFYYKKSEVKKFCDQSNGFFTAKITKEKKVLLGKLSNSKIFKNSKENNLILGSHNFRQKNPTKNTIPDEVLMFSEIGCVGFNFYNSFFSLEDLEIYKKFKEGDDNRGSFVEVFWDEIDLEIPKTFFTNDGKEYNKTSRSNLLYLLSDKPIRSFIDDKVFGEILSEKIYQKELKTMGLLNDKKLKIKEGVQKGVSYVISKYDKNNDGILDIIEGINEFELIFKKYNKEIVELGKGFNENFTHKFVKLNNYIKQKKSNFQLITESIKNINNPNELNELCEILNQEIYRYNLVLLNSLDMLVNLIEGEQLTFYELYEKFDKLNIFNTNWENEVSKKLTSILNGIEKLNYTLLDLMYEIKILGKQIEESFGDLTKIQKESVKKLDCKLSEIDSTLKVGNLISTINTYQNYKTNRRLNS